MADNNSSIIIKKIKKGGGHGHHGGAWKVAYADFVTAMMAFFLLLWLLNATPSESLRGIADYFSPTSGVKDAKGIGFYGGKSPVEDGTSREEKFKPGIAYGIPETGPLSKAPSEDKDISKSEIEAEQTKFKELEDQLKEAISKSSELDDLKNNIKIDQTKEGLRIQLVDQDKVSMFALGSTELESDAKKILAKVAEALKTVPNNISITGHTDSKPFNRANYNNWDLSTDRANSSRRFIESTGIPQSRIGYVAGKADKEHFDPQKPESSINRRISIVLLYKYVMKFDQRSAPEEVFTKPEEAKKEKLQRVTP